MGMNVDMSLLEALKSLEMDETHSNGLKWVSDLKKETNPYISIALEQAAAFGATAVYFRLFNDDRSPRPQVYIYTSESLNLDKTSEADIHHSVWNAGVVPYCFIYKGSEILVYNCGKKPDIDPDGEEFITSPHDTINLLSIVQTKLSNYSARQFDSGLFWETETGKQFKYEQSAYEQLLVQLKNVKTNIITRVGKEQSSLVKRILMMLILIKYLEERKDEHDKGALNPEEFYQEFNSLDPSLVGVLNDANTFAAVLTKLSSKEHFNGQIFLLTDEELVSLRTIDLSIFQHFVKGDIAFFSQANHGIGKMSLWRLYQFNYLPIELISHIYEDFLADENGLKKKGVVYTPPYLVQFLVDRCMPLSQPKSDFKILDPACGSGIFLVGAFKRMIQWWRLQNDWQKPQKENIEDIKRLLLNNIFGCDLEPEAVTLSYFSLGLALLDALSPKEIWKNVHFDNLVGGNLIAGDFFNTIDHSLLPTNFDLIIGNPPFESKFTESARKISKAEKLESQRPDVPDNQIALLFLEQSFKLLKDGGNCCLILPAGPVLYNTKTHDFKKYLFEKYYFKEILDFSPLRTKLFIGSSSSAKPAVVTIYAEKSEPKGRGLNHLIFRRTRSSGEKIEFEIDHYDIHRVSHTTVLTIPGVWQINFMGGGRLHRLMVKVRESSLQEYLDEKVISHGWKTAEGWIESPKAKPLQRINFLIEKERSGLETKELEDLQSKYKADWITGHPYAETDDLTQKKNNLRICNVEYFYRSSKKNKEIFQPPHLLVKESVSGTNIPVLFSNNYLTFKDKVIGIHAPKHEEAELQNLGTYISKIENVALVWLMSGQVLTSREGVPLMTDILSLPYPAIDFNDIEQLLLKDVSDHQREFRKNGENSELLKRVASQDLVAYGITYCRILNSVYQDLKPLNPIIGEQFIAYPFVLGEAAETEIPTSIFEIEDHLANVIDNNTQYNLWIRRIVRIYHRNVIFLYKPNQKRYWLRSIAVRDADETFVDLFKQGK